MQNKNEGTKVKVLNTQYLSVPSQLKGPERQWLAIKIKENSSHRSWFFFTEASNWAGSLSPKNKTTLFKIMI